MYPAVRVTLPVDLEKRMWIKLMARTKRLVKHFLCQEHIQYVPQWNLKWEPADDWLGLTGASCFSLGCSQSQRCVARSRDGSESQVPDTHSRSPGQIWLINFITTDASLQAGFHYLIVEPWCRHLSVIHVLSVSWRWTQSTCPPEKLFFFFTRFVALRVSFLLSGILLVCLVMTGLKAQRCSSILPRWV